MMYWLFLAMLSAAAITGEAEEPKLANAESLNLDPEEIGHFRFRVPSSPDELLIFSSDGTSVERTTDNQMIWAVPLETEMSLHSGKFSFDFVVENMAAAQIGVGFLLDWETLGVDWGFFGYLGASPSAWSYDPSSGDIVTNTESIVGGLPKFKDNKGVVTLELFLPADKPGSAKFIVDGVETPLIKLPNRGSVVVPAVFLLKERQKVSLQNFKRENFLATEKTEL